MVNLRIIHKIIGALLTIEALMMAACLAISMYLGEDDTLAFGISVVITMAGGLTLLFFGRRAVNILDRREAYLLVTLTWVVFSLFGSLPYLISGYITNFTDAFFETISGFTTTGCSIIDDVERLPKAMLFWRTMTQWIGGLGIVFFTIAIIPSLVGGNVKVFSAEATGPLRPKMAVEHHGEVDLEHLLVAHNRMHGMLLSGRNGYIRQCELCHDHHGDRRFLNPQCQHRIFPQPIHRLHGDSIHVPFRNKLHPALRNHLQR